ncbi:MAG TPA: aminopeptidase P family N-terminal domain-containing protein, partial [Vicinamibacterales bacterium]
MFTRRSFLGSSAAALLIGRTSPSFAFDEQRGGRGVANAGPPPPSIAALTSMRDQARPITNDERRARIERARKLMAQSKIDALMLAGGTSMSYFVNMRWGGSERLFAVIIPVKGEPFFVCPAFELDRAQEQ